MESGVRAAAVDKNWFAGRCVLDVGRVLHTKAGWCTYVNMYDKKCISYKAAS